MRYPKLRELKEAIISLVSKPYTTSFPKKPATPFKGYRGKPVVDPENCVGCETCANVCPPNAITFVDDAEKKIRIITRDYGKCIFCGMCEEHCITQKGVKLSDEIYDISTFNRAEVVEKQEFELIVCENCGAIITTKDHMIYLHDKLGPKAYSSINNLNILNEKLRLASREETAVKIRDGLHRKNMFNILCPNCNRQIQIKNLE